MLIIPLQAIPSQSINVQLAGQNCTINVYQNTYGLFCDLYVSNVLIIGGVICQNLNRIVRDIYLGFIGDLCFQDTQGSNDPDYTGLGSRYLFCYLTTSDLGGRG
jgi:hypothetical protein